MRSIIPFNAILPAPPDPILGLTEAFKKDSRPTKVNLGVGVYVDDTGKTPILRTVKMAEEVLLREEASKSYLGIAGDEAYSREVEKLIVPAGLPESITLRIRKAQTPGGTAALRIGADFLRIANPTASVWLSRPTWANHPAIFFAAGFPIKTYPYYDAPRRSLDFAGMMQALESVPAGDVVLLHVCCHNPTGVDPTLDQWTRVAESAARQGWIPFFDFAYQGFGAGLAADAAPLRPFFDLGVEFLIASSFSKNFGLYCERVGALSVVASDEKGAEAAFSHVKVVVRRMYSNPPAHGGRIVTHILKSDKLRAEWEREVADMRNRIHSVRHRLVDELNQRGVAVDFSFLKDQQGMFSFSGLTDQHVEWLRAEKAIYMVEGGRINVAGLNDRNMGYVCDAIAGALQKYPIS